MYEQYWQLQAQPFENGARAESYYPSEIHQGALLKLKYTVENRRGGAALSGASGLGKSILIDMLLRNLPEAYRPRVHVVFPQMPADQLIAFLAAQVAGLATPPTTISESVNVLGDFLAKNTGDGCHTVVVIDEAHLLRDAETLEALRLLLNFESEGIPQLSLILSGQPAMLTQLERAAGLGDRIGVRTLLRPFTQEETASYISHRMTAAGATRTIFEPGATDLVHEITQGVPRNINSVCDLALLIGFAEGKESISAAAIEAVSEEMIAVTPE